MPWLRPVVFLSLLLALLPLGQAAPLITTVDGPATVIQGLRRVEAVEGLRLTAGDIVQTGANSVWLRLEWPDGRQISLGPDSALLLSPRLPGARGAAAAYLLSGTAKTRAGLASAAVDVDAAGGDYVLQLRPDGWGLFAESAALNLRPAGAGARALAGGLFLSSQAGKLQQLPRPDAGFIASLPRPFLDSLPARAAQLLEHKPPLPKPLGAPGYAELRGWLSAEPALRQSLLPRWRPLLRDAAFRRELDKNLALHPEWQRILYPPAAAASAP